MKPSGFATMGAATTLEAQLTRLVRSTAWMMHALATACDVDPPDWLLGAGAVRSLVWDILHDVADPTPPNDLDLVFFDPNSLGEEREAEVRGELIARASELPWDVKNQAAVHLWYPRVFGLEVEPLTSSADAVGTWPETATCVAVRLCPDHRLEIVAPFGLEDLFGLVCRRNPRRVTIEEYRRRVQSKRFAERWPLVTIVDEPQ
jgi:hypothetical protein